MLRRRRLSARSLILAALVVVVGLLVLLPGLWAPVSYDEAYNLQIVANMLHGHGYATYGALYGGVRQSFDYQITTGPVLMLPITALVAVLGEHVWVYRLVPCLVSVALYVTWWVFARRLAGRLAATACVLGLLMLDNTHWIGNQRHGPDSVVGENLSVLLLLFAILALDRAALSGTLLGLAVMTKLVMLFAVPAVVIGLLLAHRVAGTDAAPRPWQRLPARVVAFVAGACAPVLAWQVVRVLDLGWSGAVQADRNFLSFAADGGARSSLALGSIGDKVGLQLGVLGIGGATALIMCLGLVAWGLAARHVHIGRHDLATVIALGAAGITLQIWWLLVERQGWVRHSNQATELLVPLLLVLSVLTLRSLGREAPRRVFTAALPLLLLAGVGEAALSAWRPPGPSLADQRHVAALVGSYGTRYHFVQLEQDPELMLLNPKLRAVPLNSRGGLLVLTGMRGRPDTSACDRIIQEYANYVICHVSPSG